MSALTAWYDDILPDLPGLTPGAFALKLIRDAAIDFAELSKLWIIDHPDVAIVADTRAYPFAPGADKVVVEPKAVLVNGVRIDPATDDDLDAEYGDAWRNGTLLSGTAKFYRCPDDATIEIIPTPSASIANGLKMRVAVKPTITAATVDDRLYNELQCRDAITAGAKFRAKSISKKPWSDPQGSIFWRSEFMRLCGVSDIKAAKGFTQRPLRSGVVHDIQ